MLFVEGLARGLPTFINGVAPQGDMDNLEIWSFNVFLVAMMVWLYYYFYSLFNAVADMNDRLISMWNEKMGADEGQIPEVGQVRLEEFMGEEE